VIARYSISYDLRRYYFYLKAGLQSIVADRALVIVDLILGTLIPYCVLYLIWTSIYSDDVQVIENFTYNQTIFYYAFALALGRLNNGYDVIENFSYFVHEGRLEAYLIKPVSYPIQRLFQFLGESIVYFIPLLFILVIFATVNTVFFQLSNILMLLILLFLSQILCYQIALLVATLTFWVVRSDVLLSFMISISSILGGTLLPPEFWPSYLLPLMKYNPFRYMIAAPAEFVVRPTENLFIEATFFTVFYIGLFFILTKILWSKGLKYYNGAAG